MIIYKTTNLITGKFYIGKDKHNNPDYIGSGKVLKQAIEKYGIDNFSKEIIEECKNEDELSEREIYWISELNARDCGYNIAEGGEGGDTISRHPKKDIIAKNHSQWMKENNPMRGKKQTKEHIDKWRNSIGDRFKGKNNPNYGNSHSIEAKKKMAEKRKEWHENLSGEMREIINNKISKANTGKRGYWKGKKNPEHSEWMKENNPMKGKTHTKEVKDIISKANSKPKTEAHKKKISDSLKGNIPGNSISVNINGISYESISQAHRELNISYATLKRRLKSNKKEYKGYTYE